MSNHARRYKLSEFKDRKMAEGAVVIETDDGKEWVIPPPELWPDDAVGIGSSTRSIAVAILGEDGFAEFVKSGGSARLLDAIFQDAQGAAPGE